MSTQNNGSIVQVIGPVVDVEFPRDAMPKVYNALRIEELDITLEVQQQLGDGVVRGIAMGTTDGLKRGMAVSDTGESIKVPVGQATLGRIMTSLVIQSTKPVQSAPTSVWVFIAKHLTMLIRLPVWTSSKPVLKLSTLLCLSPRVVRLVYSVVRA